MVHADMEDRDVWRDDTLPTVEVNVDVTEELGSEVNVLFRVDAPPVAVDEMRAALDEPGDEDLLLLAEEEPAACSAPGSTPGRQRVPGRGSSA